MNNNGMLEWMQKIRHLLAKESGVDVARITIRIAGVEAGPTEEELREWQRKVGLKFYYVMEDPGTNNPQ